MKLYALFYSPGCLTVLPSVLNCIDLLLSTNWRCIAFHGAEAAFVQPGHNMDSPQFVGHCRINPWPMNCLSCSLRQPAVQTVYCYGLALRSCIKPAASRRMQRLALQNDDFQPGRRPPPFRGKKLAPPM